MLNCNTIFLSDIHLGCKDCQAEYLLHFLQQTEANTIYLLGDIVDLWAMQRQVHWRHRRRAGPPRASASR